MKYKKSYLVLPLSILLLLGSAPLSTAAAEGREISSSEAVSGNENVTQETITYASSWEEIYDALREADSYKYYYGYDSWTVEDVEWSSFDAEVQTSSSADTSSTRESSMTSDPTIQTYSDTNLREQGVDEGDIVKTDGRYIYLLQENQYLTIVKAADEQSEVLSKTLLYSEKSSSTEEASALLPWDEKVSSYTPEEIILSGDHLLLVLSEVRSGDENNDWTSTSYTRLVTLDLTDSSAPTVIGNIAQRGSYEQARHIHGVTYLYTTMYPKLNSTLEESDLSVSVADQELSPESFCIPKLLTSASYLVYSSIRDEDPLHVCDAGVFLSGGEQFYISETSLYVLNSYFGNTKSQTQITRFAQTDGTIEGISSCMLGGYVNDTWSIDEYQGNLRVLLTYYGVNVVDFFSYLLSGDGLSDAYYYSQQDQKNALIVLDEKLQKISRIGGIGKDEEIKSARFMGDTAYFVTYQNTDPLFRVDLSDPTHPKLLDSLEIEGFSSYLHPFGDDRLLGIGYDTDPYTGAVRGLKFTMFDTSISGELQEVQTTILPGITSCPAINDYKSIFVSPEKGLFGFYYSDHYLLYSYQEDDGFSSENICDLLPITLTEGKNSGDVRGLYIGEEFYITGDSYVLGFSLIGDTAKDLLLRT